VAYGEVGGIAGRATGAGAGTLALTGAAGLPWLIVAALTLLATGIAILRLVPKREE
jgi:hypothetical protein